MAINSLPKIDVCGPPVIRAAPITGKNNRFPILDILVYLKNTHKNPKFGKSEMSPKQGIPNQVPSLGLVSLFQIWDFCGYSLITLKYPKMGICYFFLCIGFDAHKQTFPVSDHH